MQVRLKFKICLNFLNKKLQKIYEIIVDFYQL